MRAVFRPIKSGIHHPEQFYPSAHRLYIDKKSSHTNYHHQNHGKKVLSKRDIDFDDKWQKENKEMVELAGVVYFYTTLHYH